MSYIATEDDVRDTVCNFIKFCNFVEMEKPFATPKGDLSPKACYEVNKLLCYSEKNAKPTDRLFKYTSVSLWFHIAKESGLINYNDVKGNKTVFDTTDYYIDFKKMNVFIQYLLIFQTWLCFMDKNSQYLERGGLSIIFSSLIDNVFAQLARCDTQKWIKYNEKKTNIYDNNGEPVQIMMCHDYKTAHNLMDLGLIVFEESNVLSRYVVPLIAKVKQSLLGACMMKACEFRKYLWFNVHADKFIDEDEIEIYEKTLNLLETKKEVFLTPFLSCFPQNSIDVSAINKIIYEQEDMENDNRVFEFTVSLSKKCYRIIRCLPNHDFEDLHLAIQEAFDFDDDHLYSFYLDGKNFSNYAVNSPYSEESPFADETLLCDVRLKNKQHILYLFDYGDCWEFDIVLNVKHDDNIILENPEIIKTVGKAPEQYPDSD